MKQLTLTAILATFSVGAVIAQNNTQPWPAIGNVGIGTTTGNFHLQLHGTTDFTTPGTPALYDIFGNLVQPAQPGMNVGRTSRFGLTNSTSGSTANDGFLMRMSGTSFVATNQENGSINISTGSTSIAMTSSSFRVLSSKLVIGQAGSDDNTAGVNILRTSDNGLYIRTLTSGFAGLSIRSNALADNAIQVMGTNGTTRNFSVKANGEVFARKYTTTLAPIPDYVFEPSYKLMDFAQLRQYIQLNHHLPNVPSAKEYEENGVDLGEMNRVLLEKVEELTLYILQLEERLKEVEKQQE